MKPSHSEGSPEPFYRSIIRSWSALWRSRESILAQQYIDAKTTVGTDTSDVESLDQDQSRALPENESKPEPSQIEIDSLESRSVLFARFIAAWMFFWTGFLPFVVVSWWIVIWFPEVALNIWKSPLLMISSIGIFVLSFLIGMLLHAFFIRQYIRFLNWLFGESYTEA